MPLNGSCKNLEQGEETTDSKTDQAKQQANDAEQMQWAAIILAQQDNGYEVIKAPGNPGPIKFRFSRKSFSMWHIDFHYLVAAFHDKHREKTLQSTINIQILDYVPSKSFQAAIDIMDF